MSTTEEIVAKFEIRLRHYLDPQGKPRGPLPAASVVPTNLLAMYRAMVLQRQFDQRAVNLQRTGKLGTYPSALGQEAYSVAIGAAMLAQDVLCPYYRDYGAQFWRGVKMEEILLYWGGDERGSDFSGAREDMPICVPIASQTLHAVGIASAISLRQQTRAVVATIGDGGTSRGDFYEALNLAGVWKLPVVFVINNNRWAISVPLHLQTACQTLAQKAVAAGIFAEQVDGNDVVAMHAAVQEALARARAGAGPCVIEALTYRLGDHTTADDASRYREVSEVEHYRTFDPINRLRTYLIAEKLWDENQEQQLLQSVNQEVMAAVERYLQTPPRKPSSMFEHLYANLPEAYLEQQQELEGIG